MKPRLLAFGGVWLASLMLAITLATAEALEQMNDWRISKQGTGWQVRGEHCPNFTEGKAALALIIEFPWRQASAVGDFAEATRSATLPKHEKAELRFGWGDDFTGPTRGFHIAQALVDGQVVWEADVAEGEFGTAAVSVDITERCRGRSHVDLAFRVFDRKAVTNFGVKVWWTDVRLALDGQETSLMPKLAVPAYQPLPSDLPLEVAPALDAAWIRYANVLQPWGKTQHLAFSNPAERASRLRDQFGFNAFIVLPPEAHNAIVPPDDRLFEAEFDAGVAAYRKAGFRLILYSSVMHCGHAPVWQTGQLTREHPNWSQRDAEGNPVTVYGANWLCPNSPALDYTLDYTLGLVKRWQPDAVMLDNNQFYRTKVSPTCYCAHCQGRFREYVVRRFGRDAVKGWFGIGPDEMKIPTEAGPLFSLWIHWRNRVWAEATEQFRTRLRQAKPDLALFANTQYLYGEWTLATDLQYRCEDMVLSESRGQSSQAMSTKMLLGHALATGRPLWNYIGTFEEKPHSRLRPAKVVESIVAATLAHRANPWIVYYGIDEEAEANAASYAALSRLLRWWTDHRELLQDARPWRQVASLVSTRSRNCRGTRLMPAHAAELLKRHIPVCALPDDRLTGSELDNFKVVVAEGIACLSQEAARALAAWVRAGGTLIATPDVGWYDALGRLRPSSVLRHATGMQDAATGAGRAVFASSSASILKAVEAALGHERSRLDPPSPDVEIVPYLSSQGRVLLHLLQHGAARTSAVTVSFPMPHDRRLSRARLLSPYADPLSLPVQVTGRTLKLTLTALPAWSVLILE